MKLLTQLTKQRVLAALMCLSVILAVLGPSSGGRLRAVMQWAVAPIGDAGMYVTTTIKTSVGDTRTITSDDLREKDGRIRELENVIAQSQGELAELRAQKAAMSRIYQYVPADEFPMKLIAANVVARSALPYGQTAQVNSGSDRGAARGSFVTTRGLLTDRAKAPDVGLAVLSDSAVVGRLSETWEYGATLQLVTDRAFQIQGDIYRVVGSANPRTIGVVGAGQSRSGPLRDGPGGNNTPVPVTARGDGEFLIADDVPEHHNVLPGDILATVSDEYLPARLIIARVVEVRASPRNAGFVQLRMKPAADLNTLRRVYIVVPVWPQARL